MFSRLLAFFRTGPDLPTLTDPQQVRRLYERKRWSVFLSVTFGYGLFYTCRLNLAVSTKGMLDENVLSAPELGWMGAALFLVYALGRFTNGFLADRANIRRFMSLSLLGSAVINLLLGANSFSLFFVVLWAMNGWFQSVGSAPSIVALSQWFSAKERGTRYGIWSASHSIGKIITYGVTTLIVAAMGWRFGFWGPGLLCLVGALIMLRTLADRPQTYGLPHVAVYKNDGSPIENPKKSVGNVQLEVLKNPAVWILGLASAAMYMTRYGMESWGALFLQDVKGYSLVDAGKIFTVAALLETCGTVVSGWISDRFFGARRNVPVLLYGSGMAAGILLFYLTPPGHIWLTLAAASLFGFSLGGQLVFLGGLMAVDICSQRAAGAAVGLVGLLSYLGAGAQNIVSGLLIGAGRASVGAARSFETAFPVYIGAAVFSVLLTLTLWNVKPPSEAAPDAPPAQPAVS